MPNVPRGVVALLIVAATVSCVGTAQADTITITDPFVQLYNISTNTLGFASGDLLRIGAGDVVPNAGSTPSSPTTGVGTTTNTATGKTVTKNINFNGSTASPGFYSKSFADNPALYGPWTLTFTNTTNTVNTASVTVPALPAGVVPAPFVDSITISGSGGNPTFSWAPPAGATVDGYRVNIYDKNLANLSGGGPDEVLNKTFGPSVTSFTVPTALAGGLTLDPTHNYSIEIVLLQTRDNSTTDLGNANVKAMSKIYADFKPLPNGTPQVNLPVTLANGSYQYNMSVTSGQTYYIDPTVATGYVYKTGAGDPNFASFLLPAIQSAPFDVSYQLNGSLDTILLKGGVPYTFLSAGGVSTFTVTGIDAKLGLDPSNTTAFVTGLTFEGAGRFTGTQTPITSSVGATPLPRGLPLFAAGLIGLMAWFGWRNKWQSVAAITAA